MTNKTDYAPVWDGDVLQRSESAKFLTRYLDSLYADEADEAINTNSFVLCLNAEWGYGKTFLIQNWAKDLKELFNHPVVYFDAWKNDFSDDPLLAFISEFEESLTAYKGFTPKGKKLLNEVIKIGKNAIAPTIKLVGNFATRTAFGVDAVELVDAVNEVSDTVIEKYVDNALKSHNERKGKMKDFSKKLEDLLNELKDKKFSLPMYVFIDELDRCKPSYAIQLLEGVKHIFGTKGVYFIIATNKLQLSHSIQAVYGSEFDSNSYLQRFFDQEYNLPPPNFNLFAKALVTKYRLTELNVEVLRLTYAHGLDDVFWILAEGFDLSLRSQDQAMKQLKAIVMTNEIRVPIHHWYLIFLIMLKIKSERVYALLDSPNFGNGLEEIFNPEISLTGYEAGNGSYIQSNISVLNLINKYRSYEKMTAKQINQRDIDRGTTFGSLMEVLLANGHWNTSDKSNVLKLKNYRKLLSQAGQIT